MVFAKYGKSWIASTHFGCVEIKREGVGWEYSGPGVWGHSGPLPIEDVITRITKEYQERVRAAWEDLPEGA